MFRDTVQELFAQVKSIDIDPSLIEIPQDRSMGDFALPCFQFAKELKKAPPVIAQKIVDELKTLPQPLSIEGESVVIKIEALWPYINITLDAAWVAQQTIDQVIEWWDEHWSGDNKNEVLVLESPGPNTNKPLHLWHVRNMLLGNALSAIAGYAGYDTKKVDIVNDRGVHICKSMLAYSRLWNNADPDTKSDHYVGKRYVAYDQWIKWDHPEREDEIQQMLVQREQWDEKVRALWLKMRDRALDGMRETYARYGCHIDQAYYESDHYLKGKSLVQEWLASWIFSTNDRGNIIFEDDELGEKVLLRSDGTSIYITQDIALGQIRYTDWQMDRMVYVVGNEQADHFKFLFKIFERLGYEFWSKCHHLSYGMISLPDGKMKSREGNVVDADNLADEMQQISLDQLNTRYPDEDNTQLAEHIAMWAIKFFVLKYDAKKDFVFDRDESLSFDGESGPYLQYTHARCCSIKLKAGLWWANPPQSPFIKGEADKIDYSRLDQDNERLLCLHLSEFGDVVAKAADEYKPSLVARYVLELARMFNTYYQSTKVLIEDDLPLTQARLALVASVQQVLHNGLQLLWIEAPEKM